jgi:ATP-dependent Clp protease ATP-binding subunit ClpA
MQATSETSLSSRRTCYWATNLDEYQKYFEKDKALEDVSKIMVEEPDTERISTFVVSKKK